MGQCWTPLYIAAKEGNVGKNCQFQTTSHRSLIYVKSGLEMHLYRVKLSTKSIAGVRIALRPLKYRKCGVERDLVCKIGVFLDVWPKIVCWHGSAWFISSIFKKFRFFPSFWVVLCPSQANNREMVSERKNTNRISYIRKVSSVNFHRKSLVLWLGPLTYWVENWGFLGLFQLASIVLELGAW